MTRIKGAGGPERLFCVFMCIDLKILIRNVTRKCGIKGVCEARVWRVPLNPVALLQDCGLEPEKHRDF
jgi:hypothetical protein